MGSQLATLVERTEVRVAAAEAAADEARRERDAAEMALQVQRLDADADVGASADALSRNARPIEPS